MYSSWVNMPVAPSSALVLGRPETLEGPLPNVVDALSEERYRLSSARILLIADRGF